MARKRYPPTDPREWLNRAKSNLALARADDTGALLEDLCFEAQQVAEKAVKAVFVHRGVAFPFIHDLDRLLLLLEHHGVKIPRYVKDSKELTRFSVVTRYPGFSDPVTKRQYRRAVRISESVLRWAERKIGKP
jgi:HEPN domain-containing protein